MLSEQSFTLIEVVIVIGILAILAVVVILTINPSEFLKQSRDSQRLSELKTLHNALLTYRADGGSSFGQANKVYVSIPDSLETCQNLGLPSLPTGWEYRCSNSTNYRKVNGTGWVPVPFTSISYGTVLNILPIDPINTTSSGNYYTYVVGGSWNLTAFLESEKYKIGGSNDKTSKDNGSFPELYEIGTNLTLLPVSRDPSLVGYWKFDDGSGTTAYDSSGKGNNGTLTNGPTWTTGKVGGALNFDGSDDYVLIYNSASFNFGTGGWFIGMWVKTTCDNKNEAIFFKAYVPSGVTFGKNSNNTSLNVQVNSSGGEQYGDNVFSCDNWAYVVLLGNAGAGKVYSNGILKKEFSYSGSVTNSTNIWLGAGVWYNFYGLIDDVRVYNRALSAAEIMAIYNATK